MATEAFEKLGLSEDILKVIAAKHFEKPSEIQEKSIPLVLSGKDVIAGSATGSGKTLAFGAGIISNALKGKGIQGLVLTPTRELAEQVAVALEEFSYHKKLEVTAVYGGVSMSNQVKKLAYADVVVATPGRLLDHMRQRSIDLSHIKFLVLDEADRMWDMGFKEDVGDIVKGCPKERQTMLFSATIGPELEDFSSKYMKEPTEVSVESYVDASKLKQVYYDVRDDEKFSLQVHLLKNEKTDLVMIFCNTRRNADFVAKNLKLNGVDAQVIHGGMDQNKRTRVIKKFDDSTVSVLVCTDVAARGIDIQGISHVYNYDVPSDAKDYVHRIGRTARAGEEGIAINLIASRDYDNFANVQKHNQELKIERAMTPKFKRMYVKWDAPKPRGGNSRGNGRSNGRSGGKNVNHKKSEGRNRHRQSSGPSKGRVDSRGRQQRGERNKRSNKGPGKSNVRSRGGRSVSRDGFRGGGRNIRAKGRR